MASTGEQNTAGEAITESNALGKLPVELLNESFSYLSSIDLLAVAMSGKHACQILTDPKSNFVWKRARNNFNLDKSVPDPPPNLTEPAYAHFLFKTKFCAVCTDAVHRPPFSFACRVILCNKFKCIASWVSKYTRTTISVGSQRLGVLAILPRMDFPPYVTLPPGVFDGALRSRWLASDCLLEESRYTQMIELPPESEIRKNYAKEMDKRMRRVRVIMEWAGEAQEWSKLYETKRQAALTETQSNVKTYSAEQGWDLYIARFSHNLVSLRRRYERELTALPIGVLRQHRHAIELDLRRAAVNVANRELKDECGFRQDAIGVLYRSIGGRTIIPHKAEFGRLAAIKMLESLDSQTIESLLESGDLLKAVVANLEAWIQEAKESFGTKLGHEGWISISSKHFHPADRCNAFFQCKKCRRISERCALYGAITFPDACRHICRGLSGQRRAKAPWDPDMFEVDQKAVAVAQKALAATSCDEAFFSIEKFERLNHLFICKSCPSLIAMNFRSVIGHCKRHEDMELELVLPGTEGDILYHSVNYGLVDKLKKVPLAGGAKGKFGCRHCGQNSLPKYGRLHGLISHLDAKHGIPDVRDEDIFQVAEEGA